MSQKISVAICTYNRYELLSKAIESVLNQDVDFSVYKVFVVDNSPDYDRALAEQARYAGTDGLEYMIERTPGLSNARNVAARACGTPYIAFLDDDAIASRRWVGEILRAFEAFPDKAGVVGGKINPIWGRPRPSWLPDELLGGLTVVDWGGALRIAGPQEWVAGANISFAVEPLLEVGGFPTSLGRIGDSGVLLSNEEIYVLEALRSTGKVVVYAPEAEVDHLVDERRVSQAWIRKRMAWQAVSDLIAEKNDMSKLAEESWKGVTERLNSLEPRLHTPRAFFEDVQDPAEFHQQILSIYNMTRALLAGLHLDRPAK